MPLRFRRSAADATQRAADELRARGSADVCPPAATVVRADGQFVLVLALMGMGALIFMWIRRAIRSKTGPGARDLNPGPQSASEGGTELVGPI